jgi:replication initiation and membrane attachment protein DnaB
LPLERGIVGVVTRIKNLNFKDFEEASLDPKELSKKIDPEKEHFLYSTVKNYVTSYFVVVRKIMMNLDKRGEIDYEILQDQMHALYRRLSKAKKTKIQIFTEISQKIHRQTLQELIYCQVVVAYFIQSCEVFNAIT